MNEHSFVKSVHRVLPSSVYRWKIHDTYTGGVPDALYCGPKGLLFVEYKWVTLPKRSTTLVKFGISKLQLEWLDRFEMYGQHVMVAIGHSLGVLILVKGQWHSSFSSAKVIELSVSRKEFIDGIVSHTQG
ncbi:MAG: hypothetical protein CMO44_19345 [Verrucomicrobiales bacterium]|nr:hypothetical protein [Verrucomicrobiales bacterium]